MYSSCQVRCAFSVLMVLSDFILNLSCWRSVGLDQLPLDKLARQQLVDLQRVIPAPGGVRLHDLLDAPAVQIRTSQRARIEQHRLHGVRQLVAIPSAEMIKFL